LGIQKNISSSSSLVKPLVLHLQSLAPTNPHWARVVGYGPLSFSYLYGLCPSSWDITLIMLQLKYPSGAVASQGNELTPTQVKDQPTVTYEADPTAFYTLVFTGMYVKETNDMIKSYYKLLFNLQCK
jgi:hypothetical protein